MKATLDLIYCAGRSKPRCCIAYHLGFLYGVRYDYQPCDQHPVGFVDTHWEGYDFDRLLHVVAAVRPRYAVVPDITDAQGFDRAMQQAEQLAQYAERVIVVPKIDCIHEIPESYVLGYSVPTSYGGTTVPIDRFIGRKVHLLGGSPWSQYEAWRRLRGSVVSVDGNMHQSVARHGEYWDLRTLSWRRNEYIGPGHYLHSFVKSALNIVEFWHRVIQAESSRQASLSDMGLEARVLVWGEGR